MDAATRRAVRRRAGNRCEYCRVRQEHDPLFTFHIEHITPRQHGGEDVLSNLAFACYFCNRHKGPNLSALDPETGRRTRLFDPRRDDWVEHFRVAGAVIVGRTPVGRGTVRLLKMNATVRLDLRTELFAAARWSSRRPADGSVGVSARCRAAVKTSTGSAQSQRADLGELHH